MEQFIEFVMSFIAKYPVMASVFLVMGFLRAIFKPFFSFVRAVVEATETPSDNAFLDSVEKSKGYKVVAYVLDLFASFKLPGKK